MNVVAGEGRFAVLVVEEEAVAVEADEADFGTDPEEAVGGLSEGLNGVLGQAVFHDPGLATIAGKGGSGFEGRSDESG